MVLAELVEQIRIVGPARERQLQQMTIATALVRHLRRLVAVVLDRQRQAPARQRRRRLLVHPPLVANAARQQPRQPARRAVDAPAAAVDETDHVELADEVGLGVADGRQRFAALGDPLVGIEHQAPVGIRQRERRVAGGREIIDPCEVRHAGAAARRDRRRVVDRAGVQHDHLVDPRSHAREAALDRAGLVARDQHQRDPPARADLVRPARRGEVRDGPVTTFFSCLDKTLPTTASVPRSTRAKRRLSNDRTKAQGSWIFESGDFFDSSSPRGRSITLPTHLYPEVVVRLGSRGARHNG